MEMSREVVTLLSHQYNVELRWGKGVKKIGGGGGLAEWRSGKRIISTAVKHGNSDVSERRWSKGVSKD